MRALDKCFFLRKTNPKEYLKSYLEKYKTLYYKKKVEEILNHLKGYDFKRKRVLDLGCAGGFIAVLLAKKGAIVVGVDKSKTSVKAAKLYAKLQNVKDRCEFYEDDVSIFNKKKDFDIVICKDIIEHIKNDINFLKHINSLLKKQGKLIISTQNSLSFNYYIEGTIRKMLFKEKDWKGWDPTHYRFYNPKILKNRLSKAGFYNFKFSSSYFIPYLIISRGIFGIDLKSRKVWKIFTFIEDCLGKIFPFDRTGWSITISANKF